MDTTSTELTRIPTIYNHGNQKNNWTFAKPQTLRWMGYILAFIYVSQEHESEEIMNTDSTTAVTGTWLTHSLQPCWAESIGESAKHRTLRSTHWGLHTGICSWQPKTLDKNGQTSLCCKEEYSSLHKHFLTLVSKKTFQHVENIKGLHVEF